MRVCALDKKREKGQTFRSIRQAATQKLIESIVERLRAENKNGNMMRHLKAAENEAEEQDEKEDDNAEHCEMILAASWALNERKRKKGVG